MRPVARCEGSQIDLTFNNPPQGAKDHECVKIGRRMDARACVCGLQTEERLQQLVASRRANPSTAELEVRIGVGTTATLRRSTTHDF